MAPIPTYRWGRITICPRKNEGGRWIVGEIYIVLKKFDASKSPLGGYESREFPPISCADEFEGAMQASEAARACVQRWLLAENIQLARTMKVTVCPEADELLH